MVEYEFGRGSGREIIAGMILGVGREKEVKWLLQ